MIGPIFKKIVEQAATEGAKKAAPIVIKAAQEHGPQAIEAAKQGAETVKVMAPVVAEQIKSKFKKDGPK